MRCVKCLLAACGNEKECQPLGIRQSSYHKRRNAKVPDAAILAQKEEKYVQKLISPFGIVSTKAVYESAYNPGCG